MKIEKVIMDKPIKKIFNDILYDIVPKDMSNKLSSWILNFNNNYNNDQFNANDYTFNSYISNTLKNLLSPNISFYFVTLLFICKNRTSSLEMLDIINNSLISENLNETFKINLETFNNYSEKHNISSQEYTHIFPEMIKTLLQEGNEFHSNNLLYLQTLWDSWNYEVSNLQETFNYLSYLSDGIESNGNLDYEYRNYQYQKLSSLIFKNNKLFRQIEQKKELELKKLNSSNISSYYNHIDYKYKPEKIKVLFIGAFTPGIGYSFYTGNSSLLRSTIDAFSIAYDITFKSTSDFYTFFQKHGYFVENLCPSFIKNFSNEEIDFSKFISVPYLAQKINDYNPSIIISFVKSIDTYIHEAIHLSCINIDNHYSIPFPNYQYMHIYIRELINILNDIKY